MMVASEENGDIDTYLLGGGTKSVTHLIFADDALFFTKANRKSFQALKKMLNDFTEFSGLLFN